MEPRPVPTATQPAKSPQAQKFTKDEQVQVFSEGEKKWFAGRIDEVFDADCEFRGYKIKAGTLLVDFSDGPVPRSKYIRPEEVGTLIRNASISGTSSDAASAQTAAPTWDASVGRWRDAKGQFTTEPDKAEAPKGPGKGPGKGLGKGPGKVDKKAVEEKKDKERLEQLLVTCQALEGRMKVALEGANIKEAKQLLSEIQNLGMRPASSLNKSLQHLLKFKEEKFGDDCSMLNHLRQFNRTPHELRSALKNEQIDWIALENEFAKLDPKKQRSFVLELWSYQFPFETATSMDISMGLKHCQPKWSSCVGLQKSGEGKDGVLFVEFPCSDAGNALVVKAAKDGFANEVFGLYLCKYVQEYIRSPMLCYSDCSSPEGVAAIKSMQEALTRTGDDFILQNEFFFDREHFLIYEYMPATTLGDHSVESCVEWVAKTFGDPLHEHGRHVLKSFGYLVALDMLLNNMDRLPCIWQNTGNVNNVMFLRGSEDVVAIDTAIFPITDKSALDEHLLTVKALVCDVASNHGRETAAFSRIRKLLRDGQGDAGQKWQGIGLDIGEAGTCCMQEGFLDLVEHMANGSHSKHGGLQGWMQLLIDDAGVQQHWIDFVVGVCGAFREGLADAGQAKVDQAIPPLTYIVLRDADGSPLLEPPTGTMRYRDALPIEAPSAKSLFFLEAQSLSGSMHMTSALCGRTYTPPRQRPNDSQCVGVLETHVPCYTKVNYEVPTQYFPLERLISLPSEPWPEVVDPEHRERYLEPGKFMELFEMRLEEFEKMQKWKQQDLKKKHGLF